MLNEAQGQIYFFYFYGLFNDDVSSWDCAASNDELETILERYSSYLI
jgi:hypothetical protein